MPNTKFEIVNRNYRAINDSGISMKKVNTISGINDYYYNGIAQNEIVSKLVSFSSIKEVESDE